MLSRRRLTEKTMSLRKRRDFKGKEEATYPGKSNNDDEEEALREGESKRHFVGFPLVLQLILAEVLEAEHDPKLIGQYVMEYGEDKEDLWGKFDRDF
ncbi:hypothetical protein Bca4012_005842 [Brassica carinata]